MVQPDTIAAIGTPAGVSALAVVRMSGPTAFSILRSICPDLQAVPQPRVATLTRVRHPQTAEDLDQVLVTAFAGPGSYTGDDMVELSCHGGWLPPRLVLSACLTAGARMAEKGEFTRRAYLNGKMDLVQAEAVVDLIEGRSPALHRAAIHQLDRGLSDRVGRLLDGILQVEGMLAHHLDFPEEDDAPTTVGEVQGRALRLERELEDLLRTAPEGELLREGALTVLAGRPNSGKSSLFNALLGEERAIVTEVPGTTRDALEAVVSMGGFPFRVVDTAGLRGSAAHVEQKGIEVAHRYLDRSDLILFCAESGRDLHQDEIRFLGEVRDAPVLLVRTMWDDGPRPGNWEEQGRWSGEVTGGGAAVGEAGVGGAAVGEAGVGGGAVGKAEAGGTGAEEIPVGDPPIGVERTVELSARTGRGMEVLKELLPSMVFGGLVGLDAEVPVLTRARQAEGMKEALSELREFGNALGAGVPAEVAAAHLRSAETALEDVVGVVPREAVLDRVFREFCIGK